MNEEHFIRLRLVHQQQKLTRMVILGKISFATEQQKLDFITIPSVDLEVFHILGAASMLGQITKNYWMMKYVCLSVLLCLFCDPVTNALRHYVGPRRTATTPLSLQNRRSSVPKSNHDTLPRHHLVINDKERLSLSYRHHISRCSSSIYQHEIDELVVAEEDSDEGEDAFGNDIEIEHFFDEAERDANRSNFPKGKPEGYYVTSQYSIPLNGFENLVQTSTNSNDNDEEVGRARGITQEEVDRLGISGTNITLPIALMLLDEDSYPSLSRARKSCRKGHIVVNRGPLIVNPATGKEEFHQETCFKGRVIDRVYPGDVIGIQFRMHGGFYPGFDTTKPPFDLPVVYEDSHFAIVNKPAGIVCYSQRDDNHGVMTVRHALPFVLQPPKRGTSEIYLRPLSVHRLDKPTSGLLVVAKTKPAMVDISKQFVERRVKKTYTAILNGIPSEPKDNIITEEEAKGLGVDVDELGDDESLWQLIDYPLDEKSAVTVWKALEYYKSLKAKNNTLTLVELKPKTGRYHQLRRHMSLVRECPLIGDKKYDGGEDAIALRGRGLFLCSNKVVLDHPHYNTKEGRAEWETLPDNQKWANGMIQLSKDGATLEVHASIDLPEKFQTFLATENERYGKLGADC